MPVKVGLRYIEIWKSSLEKAVLEYEKEEVQKGQIVFYGPSNFTRWSEKYGNVELRDVILGKSGARCAINRGFGSSCPEHQLYYYPRMVRPLEPSVLVYSCHGNETNFGYTLEESWELAQRVIVYTLTDFPNARVYLSSANRKVGLSESDIARRREFNSWIREFADSTERCFYLDTFEYEPLAREDIFIKDGVHFNPEGYAAYAEFFRNALKDELDRF